MLSSAVQDAVLEHAERESPRECCGLVIVEAGREVYVPCRNEADSDGYFVIPARDYAAAEDRGEVVAVVHSHPDGNVEPSEADLAGCEASGVPWWIVALPCPIWRRIDVADAPALLSGTQFEAGVHDCATVIGEWYRREGGAYLPPFPRDVIKVVGSPEFRIYAAAAGFVEVPIEQQRRAGDVVVMDLPRTGGHLGVIDHAGRLCHHLYGRLSSRDAFEGMWREATTAVFRLAPNTNRK